MASPERVTWVNWADNQRFSPAQIVRPASEEELIETARAAILERRPIGMAGSAHSFSPIVETRGLLLEMTGVAGVLSADGATGRAEVLAGTTLGQLGRELWDAGLAMKNMGDVDAQTFVGATSTGTHGSGPEWGTLSSTITGLRLLTGTGELIDIDESQPDLLHAAQVSVGLLGVITRVTMEATGAYRLRESNQVLPLQEVLDMWGQAPSAHRHYSLFWAPADASSALYGLPPFAADHCYVKMLEEIPITSEADRTTPVEGPVGGRTGPAYLIYPDTADDEAGWIELEYMVDVRCGRDAFLAMRALMQHGFPEAISPIQVRWTRGEPAFISPHYGHDTCSLSVSGLKRHDWDRFLRAVDETLRPFHPRPHWGKMGYMDPAGFRAAYPELDRFLAIRAELDPHELFLGDYFREAFSVP
ncbi:MAG TPA: D-arabinono-1,4-lactone oxidase [Solirubrobacteraceae bacterium]|jgi:FAD/FMN-containing dehydrogenase